MRRILSVMVAMLCTATCEGALFLGPPVFFSGPSSQLGTVSGNTLVLSSTANGFIVSGQVMITVSAAPPVSGILVEWIVDRPLDPTYAGPFSLNTTTVLDGFSSPPIGMFQNTAGNVTSQFTNVGAASTSFIPMTLVNGLDNPPSICPTRVRHLLTRLRRAHCDNISSWTASIRAVPVELGRLTFP